MARFRLSGVCLGVLIAASAQATASAQISPAPGMFSVSGPVVFSQVGNPTMTCTADMDITVFAGGMTGAVTNFSFSPGHLLCGAFVPVGLPWTVNRITPATMGRFEILNFAIVGLGSRCDKGRLIVSWDNYPPATGYVTTDGSMPGHVPTISYPNAVCKIEGTITQVSGAPVEVD
ncbi:hypothetical protein [Brevundimonas faecalis]|uniref:Protein activator of alkane oxidation PraB n=1 Tax=Brevundimonas faecalis TaxID=947378 RepID=A0ABV2RB69_9CAUL